MALCGFSRMLCSLIKLFSKSVLLVVPFWHVYSIEQLLLSDIDVIILFPYWLAPYLIASGRTTEPSYAQIWLSITLYTLGTMIMMVSGMFEGIEYDSIDAQKYYVLQIQKGLITNGMFAYVRHPNYLGEMMIYLSFALLANVLNSRWSWDIAYSSLSHFTLCVDRRFWNTHCV